MRERGRVMISVGVGVMFLVLLSLEAGASTIEGVVSTRKLKAPKDILVYVETVEGKTFAPPEAPAKMDQINLVFVPRVLPVLKGTTVEFHNSDDLKHNVFAVGTEEFDLGVWTKGGMRPYKFDKLGDTAILCNIHPEMEAYVVVVQNPYTGLTNEKGAYKIENVPAGSYTLKTWHENLKPETQQVTVPAEGPVTINFELKR